MKAAHHRGSYHVRSRLLVANANADQSVRCWRCGLTRAEYAERHGERAARWTAGHVVDGEIDGELRPEHHRCNSSAGASYGNRRRNANQRTWWN